MVVDGRHDACLRVDSWDAACTSALFTVGGLCDGFSNVFRLCLSIAGNNATITHWRHEMVARATLSNYH